MVKLFEIAQKYVNQYKIFDVIDFLKHNNIQNLYFLSNSIRDINFMNKNITGGNEYFLDVKIQNVQYEVHIDEYYDIESVYNDNIKNNEINKKINIDNIKLKKNKNRKIINFIKLNAIKNKNKEYEEYDNCAIMIIDKEKRISTIQTINNYTDCVKCISTKKNVFKIGDILIQIIIIISLKNNLKEIHLTDNSYLLCNNSNIQLIYLRTITHGMPLYCKFGFVPKSKHDKQVFNLNLEQFKKSNTLSKEQFIKYFNYMKFDINDEKQKKIIKYINNTLIPRLKEKNNLVSYIIKSIIDDKNEEGCYILNNIIIKIYYDIGYIGYNNKEFILNLDNALITSKNNTIISNN